MMREQIPLWTLMKTEELTGYAESRTFLDESPLSNLSELLGLGTHAGLNRMMRMSGVEEPLITGGASDYDKAEALCRVMPLWGGHPYVGAVKCLLSRAFGAEMPLCSDTLPTLWERTGKALRESPLTVADLPSFFGIQRIILPLTVTELMALPVGESPHGGKTMTLYIDDPSGKTLWASPLCQPLNLQEGGKLMSEAVERLADACVARGILEMTVNLQSLASFVRPNAYMSALSVAALQKGEHLDADAHALLICQLLRLLGEACVKHGMALTLADMPSHAICPLRDYLDSCGRLPRLTVVGDDPAASLEAGVSSLLHVDLPVSRGAYLARLEAAASRAPLGCIRGLYAPLQGPLDLPLYAELCHIFCQQAEAWSAE